VRPSAPPSAGAVERAAGPPRQTWVAGICLRLSWWRMLRYAPCRHGMTQLSTYLHPFESLVHISTSQGLVRPVVQQMVDHCLRKTYRPQRSPRIDHRRTMAAGGRHHTIACNGFCTLKKREEKRKNVRQHTSTQTRTGVARAVEGDRARSLTRKLMR
jgi:hypothetical protein